MDRRCSPCERMALVCFMHEVQALSEISREVQDGFRVHAHN